MKILSNFLFAAIFAFASSLTFGVFTSEAQQVAGDDVISVVNSSDNHTVFADLIAEAELTETLQQPGPFTVLAPTDEAFEPISNEIEEIKQNPQQLQNVIINHLFQGKASSEEVETNFGIEVKDGDIDASNGVIHSIDEVLFER